MPGDRSFRTHCQDDVRLYFANAAGQVADHRIKVGPVERSVIIVKYVCLRDLKYVARGEKLRTPERGQLLIGPGFTPVGGSLTPCEADYICFNTARMVEKQRSAKCADFVIRMSCYAKYSRHIFSVAQYADHDQVPRLGFRVSRWAEETAIWDRYCNLPKACSGEPETGNGEPFLFHH